MRAFRICILVLLLVALGNGCQRSADFPRAEVIAGVLEEAVRRGPGTVVSLDTVIRGDWRRLYVITPYTNPFAITRCVGASVETYGVEVNDGITLLVLEPKQGAIRSMALRTPLTFAPEAGNRVYPRGAASFAVQEPREGSRGHFIPTGVGTRSCNQPRRW